MPEKGSKLPAIDESDVRALLADAVKTTLVAQPIVDLFRGVVVGYETLARFSLGKPAPPDRVFAAAGLAGLAEDLEALVVERALELSLRKPANTFLAINIDPQHIAAPKVRAPIERHGDLGGVVFELTEHRVVDDMSGVIGALAEMRNRGAFVAVDDAGAGYSGLKQMLEIRPQFLKLDRELVTNVHRDEAKRALIEMLGELAGRLDAWVLAEGIETELELRTLCQLGVPLGQGYFLARPAPPWCELLDDAVGAFTRLPRVVPKNDEIERLVESCPVCVESAAWPEGPRVSVRVSQEGRPLEMRVTEGESLAVRDARDLLRVKRDSSIRDVALRASTRAERVRWDPLVCIDNRGQFEGIVPLERVLCALADREVSGSSVLGREVPRGSLTPRSS